MIRMLTRHTVQILRQAGHTQSEVAAFVGISEREVRRIEQEGPVVDIDDAGARGERRIGRPSKVIDFGPAISELPKEEPKLLSVEILRRMRLKGYTGGKTALYELVRALRPEDAAFVARFEGVAGEFTQHDFGQVRVQYLNGQTESVHFFASRLKFSRWAHVTLVEDEGVETLVRSLVADFALMGGVCCSQNSGHLLR